MIKTRLTRSLLSSLKYNIIHLCLLTVASICLIHAASAGANDADSAAPKSQSEIWNRVNPVDATPAHEGELTFKITSNFLSTPDVMRRDPSDIIQSGGQYYIWYTKIHKGSPGYPHGWEGTIWYATSPDGFDWTEQGQALAEGSPGAWDSVGTYTPNILKYEDRFYLAYTAMQEPFVHSKNPASIGIAIADSPDGPWSRLEGNPVIKPAGVEGAPDGFLCDDAAFVLREGKVWLYYKAYPMQMGENGIPQRVKGRNTFLGVATADQPEGPYVKHPTVLHRGHEAVLWKDTDGGVGSLAIGWGPSRYFYAEDGIHFKSISRLNPLKAMGIYRADFNEGGQGARPTWGIFMGEDQGLSRCEFIWPEE